MDTRLIEAFLAVEKVRHFAHAADILGIAQPVVSQRLKRLEQSLGADLFDRQVHPIRLTASGEAVLPYAREMIDAEKLARRAVSLSGPGSVGRVSLGYAGASVTPMLPRIAGAVSRNAPGIEIQFKSRLYAGATQGLVVSGDLDLAFSRRPLIHSGLVERVVEYERLIVAVPAHHELAKRREISITEVVDEPWIVFPPSEGSSLREAGIRLAQTAGYTPNIHLEAPDSYSILALVGAGLGISITLSSVTGAGSSDVRFVPLSGIPTYLAATLVHSAQASATTQHVLRLLEDELETPARPEGIIFE